MKKYLIPFIIIALLAFSGCSNTRLEEGQEEEQKPEVEEVEVEDIPKSEAPMDYPFYEIVDRKGYSIVDDLNIRDLGSMEGRILTAINKGEEVLVQGEQEGWYRVVYQDTEGWIYKRYITLEKLEDEEDSPPDKKRDNEQGKSNPSKSEPEPEQPKDKEQPQWDNEELSWYFTRKADHKQPSFGSKHKKLINEYDGIAIGSSSSKEIYLTFDNGYENGYTPAILDILKENDVKAAFFVQGTYIDKNPEIIKRMGREGHLVANHTNNHPKMTKISDGKLKDEIQEVEYKYKKITGVDMPKFFRPPAGVFSERTLALTQQLGYKTVFWSMAYRDWVVDDQPGKEAAYQHVIDNIHNGAVILLHAVSQSNTEALDDIIKELKEQGYQFKSLNEYH